MYLCKERFIRVERKDSVVSNRVVRGLRRVEYVEGRFDGPGSGASWLRSSYSSCGEG